MIFIKKYIRKKKNVRLKNWFLDCFKLVSIVIILIIPIMGLILYDWTVMIRENVAHWEVPIKTYVQKFRI